MTERTVTTQAELEAALADKPDVIYISSPDGVWLQLTNGGSSHVVAWGSSHVVAWGSSHVEAWGSSHVVAWGSSHVEAWGSSHVEARESSHVEAWDSSHVEASSHVAVHLHSSRVELDGGVVIDLTSLDLTDPWTWCGYYGVKVENSIATVYKAVDGDYNAGHSYTRTSYAPGSTPEAADWRPDRQCGGGLHFGPTPHHASAYHPDATTWLACGVRLEEMSVIDDGGTPKIKAKRVVVPCVEVDRYGRPVEVVAAGGES